MRRKTPSECGERGAEWRERGRGMRGGGTGVYGRQVEFLVFNQQKAEGGGGWGGTGGLEKSNI